MYSTHRRHLMAIGLFASLGVARLAWAEPTCSTDLAAISEHLETEDRFTWSEENAARGLAMFPLEGFPAAEPAAWFPGGMVRRVALYTPGERAFEGSPFTVSPDGRWVANNDWTDDPRLIDLAEVVTVGNLAPTQPFPGDGSILFSPDGSNVLLGIRVGICPIAALTPDAPLEDLCTRGSEIGAYGNSVGATTDGRASRLLVQFDLSRSRADDPFVPRSFRGNSVLRLERLLQANGSAEYESVGRVEFSTRHLGNWMLAPSADLLIAEADPEGGAAGYRFYRPRWTDGLDLPIGLDRLGSFCEVGAFGRPAFSFDSRHVAFSHLVLYEDWGSLGFASPDDPEFLAMIETPTVNVHVLDLATGEYRPVTSLPAGARALRPAFRSDGWLYFRVQAPPSAPGEVFPAASVFVSNLAILMGGSL